MRQLEAVATLALWQAAEGRPPVERALVLAAGDAVAAIPRFEAGLRVDTLRNNR